MNTIKYIVYGYRCAKKNKFQSVNTRKMSFVRILSHLCYSLSIYRGQLPRASFQYISVIATVRGN